MIRAPASSSADPQETEPPPAPSHASQSSPHQRQSQPEQPEVQTQHQAERHQQQRRMPAAACRHSGTSCRTPSSSCPCTRESAQIASRKDAPQRSRRLLVARSKPPRSAAPARTRRNACATAAAARPAETAIPAVRRTEPRLPIFQRGVAYRPSLKHRSCTAGRTRPSRGPRTRFRITSLPARSELQSPHALAYRCMRVLEVMFFCRAGGFRHVVLISFVEDFQGTLRRRLNRFPHPAAAPFRLTPARSAI